MDLFRQRGRLTGSKGRSEDAELMIDTGPTRLGHTWPGSRIDERGRYPRIPRSGDFHRYLLDLESTCRHTRPISKKTTSFSSQCKLRQIVGFSLPSQIGSEVKIETARRSISLRTFLTEIWMLYKNKKAA